MKNILYFGLISALLPSALLAQTFAERVMETYTQTDKNYDIECFYARNQALKLIMPAGDTLKGHETLSRDFIIENKEQKIPMNFTLSKKNGVYEYTILFNRTHISNAKLGIREFIIAPVKDINFAKEFETSKITCSVNFAYALPHVLTDENYHISVHPHKVYDWQSKLKAPVEALLNNPEYKSIILLETGNMRGNLVNLNDFFSGIGPFLPPNKVDSELVNVPDDVSLIVSPAGNSRYEIQAKNEINITLSGGNHNYCIWNTARHVIENLMNSNSEAKVNFYFDTKSIVAQVKGVEGMRMNFNRRDINRSNLLKDLLSNKSIQASYHTAYIEYFKNWMAVEYAGMYRTYKINYKAEGYNTTVTKNGQGVRDIEISFIYL